MSELSLELGPEMVDTLCPCCGLPDRVGEGVVQRDGYALAHYFIRLHARHPRPTAIMVVVLDADDDEASGWEPGLSFVIRAWTKPSGLTYGLCDPDEAPWELNPWVTGETLTPVEARAHPAITDLWPIVDFIHEADPAFHRHFELTGHTPAGRHMIRRRRHHR